MFPVDLPAAGDTDLTLASERYFSSLESIPHKTEEFQSSATTKTSITASNVRRLQLFEDGGADCSLLALHPSGDPTQVLAVYLHDKWWPVDDVLRTTAEARRGLVAVQSIVERVIVFLLSRVVDRSLDEDVRFSPHPRAESCSLLWRGGRAVGFYTVKRKGVMAGVGGFAVLHREGSLCDGWSGRCYLLPVLDTVLVRKSCRRRGFGSQMLENFCSTFCSESILGVSSPLSPGWAAVCRRFLQQHEEYRDRLYEVEAPGSWNQRRNIWLSIQLGRYSLCINEANAELLQSRNTNQKLTSASFPAAKPPREKHSPHQMNAKRARTT